MRRVRPLALAVVLLLSATAPAAAALPEPEGTAGSVRLFATAAGQVSAVADDGTVGVATQPFSRSKAPPQLVVLDPEGQVAGVQVLPNALDDLHAVPGGFLGLSGPIATRYGPTGALLPWGPGVPEVRLPDDVSAATVTSGPGGENRIVVQRADAITLMAIDSAGVLRELGRRPETVGVEWLGAVTASDGGVLAYAAIDGELEVLRFGPDGPLDEGWGIDGSALLDVRAGEGTRVAVRDTAAGPVVVAVTPDVGRLMRVDLTPRGAVRSTIRAGRLLSNAGLTADGDALTAGVIGVRTLDARGREVAPLLRLDTLGAEDLLTGLPDGRLVFANALARGFDVARAGPARRLDRSYGPDPFVTTARRATRDARGRFRLAVRCVAAAPCVTRLGRGRAQTIPAGARQVVVGARFEPPPVVRGRVQLDVAVHTDVDGVELAQVLPRSLRVG